MRKYLIFIIHSRSLKYIIIIFLLSMLLSCYFLFTDDFTTLKLIYRFKQPIAVVDIGVGPDKEINRSVALPLKTELQNTGIKVIFTHESIPHNDLLSRVDTINKAKPDLFISLNCNSNPISSDTNGPMVFYDRRIPASFQLAKTVQKHINQTAATKGLGQHNPLPAEYYLLKNSLVPGVVIELGFVTNLKEKGLLQTEAYQLLLAKQIAKAVNIYFNSKPNFPLERTYQPLIQKANMSQPGFQLFFPRKNSQSIASEALINCDARNLQMATLEGKICSAVQSLMKGPINEELEPAFSSQSELLGVVLKDRGIAELEFKRIEPVVAGSYAEFLALSSLVETVCQFPGINGLKIRISDKTPLTLGHHMDISKVLLPEKPKAKIAIVIDDLAGGNQGLQKLLDLHRPLTMAIMPKRETTHKVARLVHQKGYPVFLHLPMEPIRGKLSWLGEGAITTGMSPKEVARQVEQDLNDIPYVIGLNNHMGSKVTQRRDLMMEVMKIAKSRKLIVLDSKTTEKSVIPQLALELGVPLLERSIFLDEINSKAHVKKQIMKAADMALSHDAVIAIGHVGITGNNTAIALAEMIPWLDEQGIALVFAHELIEEAK